MMVHRINSIYKATEGEGIFLGTPQVFIRYQGCEVGCANCDSKDTWSFRGGKVFTTEMVLESCIEAGFCDKRRRISITGGDPLDPKHVSSVIEIIHELKKLGAWINIEAAGDKFNKDIFDAVDFISFDVKTPSTGVPVNKSLVKNFIEQYSFKSQVKSVVFDKEDFDFIESLREEIINDEPLALSAQWVITPVYNYGEKYPKDRVEKVIEWNDFAGASFRVISQQHKWIYGPNKKFI